jgi:hypothetical protein
MLVVNNILGMVNGYMILLILLNTVNKNTGKYIQNSELHSSGATNMKHCRGINYKFSSGSTHSS